MPENTVFSPFTRVAFQEILQGSRTAWAAAEKISINRYWNGQRVPEQDWNNSTIVSSVWTANGIWFCFECGFDELNVNPDLGEGGPIDRLWDYDVVEAFVRPLGCEDYFEIEVSPLGQWLDVHILRPRKEVDFSWNSELQVSVRTDPDNRTWTTVVNLPFEPILAASALRRPPAVGDIWRLNLFRAAGTEPNREHLTWRPTLTPSPDFHVPTAFGNLIFTGEN